MKKCPECERTLPLTDFYRHPDTADGLLSRCKACHKAKMRERYFKKAEDPAWLERERARGREKYHRLGYLARYAGRGGRPARPEQRKAYNLCQHVPCPEGYQRHHWSYREEDALDVILLPQADHYRLHRYLTYDPKEMKYRTVNGTLLATREEHETYAQTVLSIPF